MLMAAAATKSQAPSPSTSSYICSRCWGRHLSPSPQNPGLAACSSSTDTRRRLRAMSTKDANKVAKALFSVNGMTYSPCAGVIEEAVNRLPGIRNAVVDFLNYRAQVLYNPGFVDVSWITIAFFSLISKKKTYLSI